MKKTKSNDGLHNKKQEFVKSLHAHRKRVFVAFVVVAIISIGLAVVLCLGFLNDSGKNEPTAPMDKDEFDLVISDMQSTATDATDKASNIADGAIKKTNDNYQKTVILITEASVYYDNEEYDRAMEIAFEAYDIEKNDNVCGFIAMLYEDRGDKQKAIEYYQNAIDYLGLSNPEDGDIEYYENMIKLLNGQTIDYEE